MEDNRNSGRGHRWVQILVWAVGVGLYLGVTIALLLSIPPAYGYAIRATGEKTMVTLYDRECINPSVIAHISASTPFTSDMFVQGQVTIDGKTLAACGMLLSMEELLMVLEDGRMGTLPLAAFEEVQEV